MDPQFKPCILEKTLPVAEIRSSAFKDVIFKRLNQLARFAEVQTNLPFAYAQFLTAETCQEIRNPGQEWVVAPLVPHATRYLLMLFVHENLPRGILIGRARQTFLVSVHAPKGMYDGSLLDGQVATHNTFVAFDVLSIAGKNMCDEDYVTRMRSLPVFQPRDPHQVSSTLELQSRPFWHWQHPPAFLGDRIYILVQAAWQCGRSAKMYRLQTRPAIDFALMCEGGSLQLALRQESIEPSKRTLLAVITQYPITDSLLQLTAPHDIHGQIVEFQWSHGDQHWVPHRARRDRLMPNRISSYERALQAIRDASATSSLLNFF